MLITTLIIFLLVLGVLVFVHEFGHFIMAKRAGMKVEEFGFGFPPKIFGFKRGETEYTINLIPLGGFVKILGENGEDKSNPRSFSAKSAWQRFRVLIAGVSANVILAVTLFSIVSFVGAPTIVGDGTFDKPKAASEIEQKLAGVKTEDILKLEEEKGIKPFEKEELKVVVEAGEGSLITNISINFNSQSSDPEKIAQQVAEKAKIDSGRIAEIMKVQAEDGKEMAETTGILTGRSGDLTAVEAKFIFPLKTKNDAKDINVKVLSVADDSPAKNAGIKPGDVISYLKSNGDQIEIKTNFDVETFIQNHKGKEVTFGIIRGSEKQEIKSEVGLGNGVKIFGVADDSPAKNAGIKPGDVISYLKSNGDQIEIKTNFDVETFIQNHKGKEVTFGIIRGSEKQEIKAEARTNAPEGQGATGISLSEDITWGEVGTVSYSWYEAIWQGLVRTMDIIILIFATLYSLLRSLIFTGQTSQQLAGPVGIAVIAGQAAQLGLVYILQFTAMLSVNLAVINALPFPALDGGRILFLTIEKIKGKPVSQETENTIHTIGFIFLLLLMVLVTFGDFSTYKVWDKIRSIF